ncbi:MAG: galactokinase [Oscillospiraceae bacterium]|jgi:galactokinase|nr:galactokinase [Oscillospiraceae bacterium]
MTEYRHFVRGLETGAWQAPLEAVYGGQAAYQTERLLKTAATFAELFGTQAEVAAFSAPGRTEIGGNHTDHNCGKVLAASINLDAIAVAAKREDGMAVVKSAGHDRDEVDTRSLLPRASEEGRSVALLRGVCAGFVQRGYKIGGFEAATMSDVLSGSGLSSSAAFEVLLGTILNHLYNDGQVPAPVIAQIAQYAENRFFGKPCGLMDQTACAVGGFVAIDFGDTSAPAIQPVPFDFASCGHALCIVDSGGSHADLTEDYGAVRGEMESVAQAVGKSVLRETSRAEVLADLPRIREETGDRALLRTLHFFAENERVDRQAAALQRGDFEDFKTLIRESGRSSCMYNQNVYTGRTPPAQPVSLALALSEAILGEAGAWRVHGGGFAGTIQAFVPLALLETYRCQMEQVFGGGSCYVLEIRPSGGIRLL